MAAYAHDIQSIAHFHPEAMVHPDIQGMKGINDSNEAGAQIDTNAARTADRAVSLLRGSQSKYQICFSYHVH